ncbi:hypothetical protein EQM14_06770 [Caproiciproducens sp. NJN-50]|uniref:hypothetical protein n=1 Tax=Acutalibacteraceae TaxID=3082771 RepID=UPI000FFDFF4C|nr:MULTISPECIES: hypothetical protein [Acutalibacteraceae]QAT49502.1 hypothetical protein EQM14_06770 [Caproiciproducens sp. NJN-50]
MNPILKIVSRLIGLVLLFLNFLYCSFLVQEAKIAQCLEIKCLGSGYTNDTAYIHPVSYLAVIANFIIVGYLLYLSFTIKLARFYKFFSKKV